QRDNNLATDEIITAILMPPSRFAANSHYLKVRDRASYAFALVSVAVALRFNGRMVEDARIVLGGVAHKPWRVAMAEKELIGRSLDDSSIARAAQAAVQGSQPLTHNAFKVELTRGAVTRALKTASA